MKLYKKKYIISFYDENDETLLYVFDNIREILKFKKMEITKNNINSITTQIYKALQRDNHNCKFLTGKLMKCYIIDINE